MILSPTAKLDYAVEIEGEAISDGPIRAILKPHPDGGYVLLTVNLDNAIMKATYSFEKPLTGVEAMFENREDAAVEFEADCFKEDYEPFEVHVYRLRF